MLKHRGGVPTPRDLLPVEVRWLGSVPYHRGADLQQKLVASRRQGSLADQLLLLEHPHVITMGSASDPAHVLAGPEQRKALGIDLVESGRGGDVTYHGPGQLIGYPILDLNPDRKDIHRYLRDLEEVVIRVVRGFGIGGVRIAGSTGVWTKEGKIAAIGVRVSSGWITSHGFALNVNTDLTYFGTIVPCGLTDKRVTSLEHLLRRSVAMDEVIEQTTDAFGKVFERPVRRVNRLP